MELFHFSKISRIYKYIALRALSKIRNTDLDLVLRLITELGLSIELVEYISFLMALGYLKYAVNSSQLFSQDLAIFGKSD